MVLTSEFWMNFIFFLLQIALSIAGIWVGIYLYLRQQQKDQTQKYEAILARIRELRKEISDIKSGVLLVDRATSETHKYLLETNRELSIRYTRIPIIIPDLMKGQNIDLHSVFGAEEESES